MTAKITIYKQDLAQYGEKHFVSIDGTEIEIQEHQFNHLKEKWFKGKQPKRTTELSYWKEVYE